MNINPLLKRASFYFEINYLRFSDIRNLVLDEIEYIEGNGYIIQFKQQKTKGTEMMPISEQGYGLLGEPKEHNSIVFKGLSYSANENKHHAKWIGLAVIEKEITFHFYRHTYATIQMSQGTDIYSVSNMLGHRELKSTQIYIKIIDQAKRDTTTKIKLNFNN